MVFWQLAMPEAFAGGVEMVDRAGPTQKLNVFISYGRQDLGFADQLDAALRLMGYGTILDRKGISGGEDWNRRLGALIRDADTVVFVLSPASATSDVCGWEVAEAKRLGKRVIPVLCSSLGQIQAPAPLAELNYIFFYDEPKAPGSGFGTGLERLSLALDADLEWLREHTRLLQRATEWETGERRENRLLSGPDIAAAKDWIARRPKDAPEPTALHYEFIQASEAAANQRQSEEHQRLAKMQKIQEEREEALRRAEIAQKEKEASTRILVRRTTIGMAVALVLAVIATSAGLFAYKNQKKADGERERAERNLGAVTQALSLLDSETDPKQLAPKFFALAHNYLKEGHVEEAYLLYKRTLIMAETRFGIQSSEAIAARTQIGIVAAQLKHLDEAERELSKALAIIDGLPQADTSDLPVICSALAQIYRDQGKVSEAAAFEARSRRSAIALAADAVTVFYGTDRARRDVANRVSYGPDRARRLEIGRALVTIPKDRSAGAVPRPWDLRIAQLSIYRQVEDHKKHQVIEEIATIPKVEFVAKARELVKQSSTYKAHALVYIHGYNTTFDDALYRTAQLTYDLKFDGAAFLYTWPSSAQSYIFDRDSVQVAGLHFKEFLDIVLSQTGAEKVNLIAHGLGNQLLLPVLRDLKARNPAFASNINEIVLAAPDIDRDAFLFLNGELQGLAKGITLYASSNDVALQAARIVSNNRPRAGDIDAAGPTIAPGVDTIDVSVLSSELMALNHAISRTALFHDMELLFKTGRRPPNLRNPALVRVTTPSGEYWRFPP